MKGGLVVAVTVLLPAGAAPVASQWPELTGFNIAVTRTAKGVSLACAAGCSWQRLEFGLTVSGKPTPVNEHGMADDKTANAEKAGNFLIRFGTNDDGFALSCESPSCPTRSPPGGGSR